MFRGIEVVYSAVERCEQLRLYVRGKSEREEILYLAIRSTPKTHSDVAEFPSSLRRDYLTRRRQEPELHINVSSGSAITPPKVHDDFTNAALLSGRGSITALNMII
jgi:hypothetical protein